MPSISARVWSATLASFTPGAWVTAMPRARAAAWSTFSKPAPKQEMIFSPGRAAIDAAGRPMEPLVSTAITGFCAAWAANSGPGPLVWITSKRSASVATISGLTGMVIQRAGRVLMRIPVKVEGRKARGKFWHRLARMWA